MPRKGVHPAQDNPCALGHTQGFENVVMGGRAGIRVKMILKPFEYKNLRPM